MIWTKIISKLQTYLGQKIAGEASFASPVGPRHTEKTLQKHLCTVSLTVGWFRGKGNIGENVYLFLRAQSFRVSWDKLWLLKTMMFLESIVFYKMCLKSRNLQLETKKKYVPVFNCSLILYFFLKYLPRFWQCNALNVFFTWIISKIKLGVVTFVEKVSRWNSSSKNIKKRLLVEDIKISYLFY